MARSSGLRPLFSETNTAVWNPNLIGEPQALYGHPFPNLAFTSAAASKSVTSLS